MTNLQLFFTAGFPTLVILIGILVNRSDVNSLRADLGGRIEGLNNRIDRFHSDLSGRIDLLTGKVIELTCRVFHFEARMGK